MAQQVTAYAVLTLLAAFSATAFADPAADARAALALAMAPSAPVADAGLFLVGADVAVNAGPQAPAAKACRCSPECVCGCQQGGVCQCAGSARQATASYWSCGPNGCRLVTAYAPAGGCADGSCGAAVSGVYGGGCGPGGCGATSGPAYGGGRFFGGRGRFFGGRGGRGGCASCR